VNGEVFHMLTGGTIIRYLFGQAEAIRTVASARSALVTGIILVFLTSIARNYDQTHISENAFRWLFGSLLFSLVSGTWLFLVSYCGFARRGMEGKDREATWSHWPQFMGLFWMTAPIAWLYAIPVERFMEPVAAAKTNITLLVIVSIWRVLLMSRVLQVLCRAPFSRSLVWTLFPAAVEVLIVAFLGGFFTRAIMMSMAGLRNSPVEDVIHSAVGNAFTMSFYGAPLLLIVAIFWKCSEILAPFPKRIPAKYPVKFLTISAICWVVVAIPNQRQLWHSAQVDEMIKEERFQELLAYYSSHERKDFAPARILPPKMYEGSSFTQLPLLISRMDGKEPPWVRELMVEKLKEIEISMIPVGWELAEWGNQSVSNKIEAMAYSYADLDALRWNPAILKLAESNEGKNWLSSKPLFLTVMANKTLENFEKTKTNDQQGAIAEASENLLSLLKAHGIEPTKSAK
jgi:hypothetical protein